MPPSPEAFAHCAGNEGLVVAERSFHGIDYAETLRRRHASFVGQEYRLRRMGYDRRFQRMWRYYLAYCKVGFIGERINCMQTLLVRPTASISADWQRR